MFEKFSTELLKKIHKSIFEDREDWIGDESLEEFGCLLENEIQERCPDDPNWIFD